MLQNLEAQEEMAGFMFDGREVIGGNFGGGDGNLTLLRGAPAVNKSEPSSGGKGGFFFPPLNFNSLSLIWFHFKKVHLYLYYRSFETKHAEL